MTKQSRWFPWLGADLTSCFHVFLHNGHDRLLSILWFTFALQLITLFWSLHHYCHKLLDGDHVCGALTSRLRFSDVVFVFCNRRQMLNLTDRMEPRRLLCNVTIRQKEIKTESQWLPWKKKNKNHQSFMYLKIYSNLLSLLVIYFHFLSLPR